MNILMPLWPAFVIMACATTMIANGGGVEGILFTTTTNLNAANKAAR